MQLLNKTLCLWLVATMFVVSTSNAQQFTIGTYNIRYANHSDSVNGNGWGERSRMIINMIQFHGFDIFGTQEGLYHQLETLKTHLPGYQYIGVGRDDGKHAGEHSAIFYQTNKFELLESGDFWLSTITDRPNKGWDAALPRICTWGKFKEKGTHFEFYMFNLHMDHIGVQARAESAKLILQKIKSFPKDKPVILTGDFNVDQYNESYTLLNTSGLLKDAFDLSPIRLATVGTFNNFSANKYDDKRIDHIFLSKAFNVQRYGVLTDTYRAVQSENAATTINNVQQARVPSDHFPVLIGIKHSMK